MIVVLEATPTQYIPDLIADGQPVRLCTGIVRTARVGVLLRLLGWLQMAVGARVEVCERANAGVDVGKAVWGSDCSYSCVALSGRYSGHGLPCAWTERATVEGFSIDVSLDVERTCVCLNVEESE